MTKIPFRPLPFRLSRSVAAFAAGGLLAFVAAQADLSLISRSNAAPATVAAASAAAVPGPAAGAPLAALPDFSALVEQVGLSLIHI